MNDQSNRYKQLSILAIASFVLLVILQVSWLIYAAQSQRSIIEQNLEILAPDIALEVNAIDHDAFHANRSQLTQLPDTLTNEVVQSALQKKNLSPSIRYAIYDDSTYQIIQSNAPQLKEAFIQADAKACLSCIVSFSTISPEQAELIKEGKSDQVELLGTSTFQYYSPIVGGSQKEAELWFALYHPEILKETLGNLIGVFIGNIILLCVLLSLFYYLLKSLSRYKAASKTKEEFFNNMTHEFKTPLSSIRLASRILLKNPTPEKQNEYLQLIDRESVSLENQIDKILELSLLENEVITLNKEDLNLSQIINKIPVRLLPLIEKKAAQIQIELPETPIQMSGDAYHLINALSNLVENSLKYSDNGVTINISATNSDGIQLVITDNGPGIQPEHQDHIFERFYRGHHNNQYKGAGFGIGLSYVQTIIEEHGGRIALDIDYLNGTSFIITL